MADIPIMPVYTDALLGDTTHLDATEFGAYCLILFTMWRNGGSLPDDDARLAKVARVNPSQWRKIGPVLREFLTPAEDGKITQKRLASEFAERLDRRAAAAQNGAKGGTSKSLKTRDRAVANATRSLEQTPSETPSEPLANGERKGSITLATSQLVESLTTTDSAPQRAREAASQAAMLEIRKQVRAVFDRNGYDPVQVPETGHAETWIAAGFRPDIIVRVISDGLPKARKKVRSLRYFDEAMRAAHADLPPERDPTEPPPSAKWDERLWRVALEDARRDFVWHRGVLGPRVGEAGCIVPANLILESDATRRWRDPS